MTMSRTTSPAVKCFSMCGVVGVDPRNASIGLTKMRRHLQSISCPCEGKAIKALHGQNRAGSWAFRSESFRQRHKCTMAL